MPLTLVEDALGDPRNAQALALASDLAYLPLAEGVAGFHRQLGLEARLLSVDNTQAYLAQNADAVVLAFRGTETPTSVDGLKDWLLTDAVNLLILPEGRLGTDFVAAGVGARFHQGFLGALTEIWDPVFAAVEAELRKNERPLWLTGHSLGGALALMSGWLFQRRFVNVHQIYTFGAPMIGNAAASQAFDREFPQQVYRYINPADPVPRLPTVSLLANDYGHCRTEMVLGATAGSGEGATFVEQFQQLASTTVNGIIQGTLIDDVWTAIKNRIGSHAMRHYLSLVQPADTTRA